MKYDVLFKVKLEMPPAMKERQKRVQKVAQLPFPPYDLPRGYPIFVDDVIGTRRVQEQRYYLPADMFVVELQPEIRYTSADEAADALARLPEAGWEDPSESETDDP